MEVWEAGSLQLPRAGRQAGRESSVPSQIKGVSALEAGKTAP